MTPRPASFNEMNANHGMASQLAESTLSHVEGLKQGSPIEESVHSEGRTAGVGPWETNFLEIQMMQERRALNSG